MGYYIYSFGISHVVNSLILQMRELRELREVLRRSDLIVFCSAYHSVSQLKIIIHFSSNTY